MNTFTKRMLAVTCASTLGLSAYADEANETVILKYDFQGQAIEGTIDETGFEDAFKGIDIVGGGEDGLEPDGLSDLSFIAFAENEEGPESGAIFVGLNFFEVILECEINNNCPKDLFDTGTIVTGAFARDEDGELIKYSEGELVIEDESVSFEPLAGDLLDPVFGAATDIAILYGGDELESDEDELASAPVSAIPEDSMVMAEEPSGDLLDEDETAIFGFALNIFQDEPMIVDDEMINYMAEITTVVPEDRQLVDLNEERCPEFIGCREQVATLYGFIEVTRGSIIPGMLGVNFNSNQGALIPMSAVPLPAAGWMLIAGVGGLVAAGRRKAK